MGRPPLPIGTWGKVIRRQLGPGKWQARAQFRDHDGITRPVTAQGKAGAAAENALKTVLAKRATPMGGDDLNTETTLSVLADRFLDEIRAEGVRKTSTIDGYAAVTRRSIKPAVGQLRIREATTGRLDRLVKKLRDTDGKPSEARHVKVVLSLMFDMAMRHDATTINPARGVTRLAKPKREVEVLTLADVAAVRELIDAWTSRRRPGPKTNRDLSDIVALHLATGCRIGEVLAFQWKDITEEGDRMLVAVTGTIVTPKGGGATFRQSTPKSDASCRTIVLPNFAANLLRARRALTGGSAIGAVFATRNDTWKSPNNVRRQWRAARKGSAYEWVTPHVFRKTVATLVDEVTDTKTASGLLGHATEIPTKTHYIKKPTLAPDVADVLEAFAPEPDEDAEEAS